MDSHDGKECEECKEVREVVEMKLEVERGTSTDLSAQKKYKYDEPDAGGALNFLLGREINEAAADHDGEEYKEREEGGEEVDVVKTAEILLDMAAGVVQFNDQSMDDDNGNTQQSNSTREKGEEDGTNGRTNKQTNE
jgi:hypothetical protein